MNEVNQMSDLLVLVADVDMKLTLDGLLQRKADLEINFSSHQIYVHPEHDPGCYRKAEEFLRPFLNQFKYSLVLFDRKGCGKEDQGRDLLEADVEKRLRRNGWEQRAAAVAIDPELENWIWSDSPDVVSVLGRDGKNPNLWEWLTVKGHVAAGAVKPVAPKQAMIAALKQVRRPRSSSYFNRLARSVDFTTCQDPSFLKLKGTLQGWFPPK